MKERDYTLDLIKTTAMLGVIALHSMMYYITPGHTGLADILYDLGMTSMPLFFMVSGYLMIPRESLSYSYFMHKIWGIIRFVTIIVVLFSLYRYATHGFDVSDFIYTFFGAFTGDGRFYIFWYFTAIILCYLLTPVLSDLYHRNVKKYISILVTLLLLQSFFFSNSLTNIISGSIIEYQLITPLRIHYTLFYYMLGGIICIKKVKLNSVTVFFLLCVNIIYKEVFDKHIGNEYASLFYSSIPCILLAASIFLYFKGMEISSKRFIALSKHLSSLFLPVYALHTFVIDHLPHHHYDTLTCAPLITLFLVSSITICLSYILMQIPILNKVFRI